jgi:hypothetical protein
MGRSGQSKHTGHPTRRPADHHVIAGWQNGKDGRMVWERALGPDGERLGGIAYEIRASRKAMLCAHETFAPHITGPFFHPDGGGRVLYINWMDVEEAVRGAGVYEQLVERISAHGLPVYGYFTNKRLGERWQRLHAF